MKKIIETKLGKVEEAVAENECLQEVGYFEMERDKYHLIELDNACISVPALNVDLYSGIYSNWNDETGEYEADFSLTVVKEMGCADDAAFITWESDGPTITLANTAIAHEKGLGLSEIEMLDCEIWIRD